MRVRYCLYNEKEWHRSGPCVTLADFLAYVRERHTMQTPKAYITTHILTTSGEHVWDREKVDDDLFQSFQDREFYVFEGANGKDSPLKGRNGPPLIVDTRFVSTNRGRGSPKSSSGSGSGSVISANRSSTLSSAMREAVMTRDRYCVISGDMHRLGSECENCHIIALDENVRRLDPMWYGILKGTLEETDDWKWIEPLLVPRVGYVSHLLCRAHTSTNNYS